MFGIPRTLYGWLYWIVARTIDTPVEIPGSRRVKGMADAVTEAAENIQVPFANWRPTGSARAATLMAFTVLPLGSSFLISRYLRGDIRKWYKSLSKPSWAPTKWLLSPIWSLIYLFQGYAGYRVWSQGGLSNQVWPMCTYMIYMLANSAWKPILFRMKKMDLALLGTIGTLFASTATIRAFNKVDTLAACLLLPDWIYLTYASLFIAKLLQSNPQKHLRFFSQAEALPAQDGEPQEASRPGTLLAENGPIYETKQE